MSETRKWCQGHPGYKGDFCSPMFHSPGGVERGTQPFRPGKTRADRQSGAWARRYANRQNDPGRRAA